MFANIIVDVPIKQTDQCFTYRVPPHLEENIAPGMRVFVPFGRKRVEGFVLEISQELPNDTPVDKIKAIVDLIDLEPVVSNEHIQLGRWMANRYFTRAVTAWQTMLPSGIRSTEQKRMQSTLSIEQLDDFILTDNEREILTYLIFEKQVKLSQVYEKFPNAEASIEDLKKRKFVIEVSTFARMAKPKLLQYVAWSYAGDIGSVRENLKQAKKQLQVAEIVYAQQNNIKQGISIIELERQLGASRQSLKSLQDKGIVTVYERESMRTPDQQYESEIVRPRLTAEQAESLRQITKSINSQGTDIFLLHGVTGSGKTEIYLQAIQQVVNHGKQAIVLVPEISLTPQIVERFRGLFAEKVAVMHSRLSYGERFDEWRRIKDGDAKVIIGARSAIFAPTSNLGIIIIDEEHESSYKQEDNPRYDAREVAFYRAKWHQCPVVLGSATPTIESYYYAQNNKYKLLTLKERVFKQEMPEMTIVDMSKEVKAGNYSIFSRDLQSELQQVLARKHQAILFINRRGHSNFVMCRECGEVSYCPHCNISLTFHKKDETLQCHYCSYQKEQIRVCFKCKSTEVDLFGIGTEKIETELQALLPEARIARMDIDTTKKKGSHQKILNEFQQGNVDFLIGTQMVAKGLDFPNVALVGVISADVGLNMPDFRASERTFQLITQVGGRAGRHKIVGKVTVQTHSPDHYSIGHAVHYEYDEFYEREISLRKQLGYPPFSKLIYCTFSHTQEQVVKNIAEEFAILCRKKSDAEKKAIYILGPNPASLSKIKNRYRYSMIIKYASWQEVSQLIRGTLVFMEDVVYKSNVIIAIDVNPQMLL